MCFFHMLIMMFTSYALRARNPRVKIFCFNVVGSFRQGFWLNMFLLHYYMGLDPVSSFKWSAYTLGSVASGLLEVDIFCSLIYSHNHPRDIYDIHYVRGTVLFEKSEVNKMFCLHFRDSQSLLEMIDIK